MGRKDRGARRASFRSAIRAGQSWLRIADGGLEFEDSEVSDALTYADQTVGPHGKRMKVEDRIAEAIKRHGPDSPNAQARVDREPYLLAVADRVERRLAAVKRN